MSTILDEIIAQKHKEINEKKQVQSIEDFKQSPHFNRTVISAKASILNKERTGIIAEFKRKSPSKGFINQGAKVKEVVLGYEKFGASVVSVLTDEQFFGGCLFDLKDA